MKNAAVVIPMHQHRFLILRRSGSDPHFPLSWDFPGGGLEPGEDPSTGALRELSEEAAIEASKDDLEKVGTFEENGVILHLYKLKVLSPVVRCRDGEHDQYAWVPPKIIDLYPLMPGTKKILSHLQK